MWRVPKKRGHANTRAQARARGEGRRNCFGEECCPSHKRKCLIEIVKLEFLENSVSVVHLNFLRIFLRVFVYGIALFFKLTVDHPVRESSCFLWSVVSFWGAVAIDLIPLF